MPFVPGKKLRALIAVRRHQGLSTGEVADRLLINVRSYERLEAGAIRLSLQRLLEVAQACGGDPFSLLAALVLDAPQIAVGSLEDRALSMLMARLAQLDAQGVAAALRALKETLSAFDPFIDDGH